MFTGSGMFDYYFYHDMQVGWSFHSHGPLLFELAYRNSKGLKASEHSGCLHFNRLAIC